MPSVDPQKLQTLRSLKGAPISLLAAFFLAASTGADTCSAAWLGHATDWSPDITAQGLQALQLMGYVEQVQRYQWRLTTAGQQLPLPFEQLVTPQKTESDPAGQAPTAGAGPSLTPFKSDSHSHQQVRKPAISGPRARDSAKNGVTGPITTIDNYRNTSIGDLLGLVVHALELGGVHHQMRPTLARELIQDDSADWPWHVLGWLAYCTAHELRTPKARGATMWTHLRDRIKCDDAYLPPAGLSYGAALLWADKTATKPEDAIAPSPAPEAGAPEPPAPPVSDDQPEDPTARAWAAALHQLQLEIPRGTYETWLKHTQAVAGDEPDHVVVVTANRHARDWLSNRLHSAIKRALQGVLGREPTITYTSTDQPATEG